MVFIVTDGGVMAFREREEWVLQTCLINARHKRTKKMQWTREGAHHVLQIRAMMASEEWESKGRGAVLSALGAVA